MTEIETRLRADAQHHEPVPSFQNAVIVATSSRSHRHAWLAAAAAVIAVGGVTALTIPRSGTSTPSTAGSSSSTTNPATADASVVGAIVTPGSGPSTAMELIVHQPGPDADTCPSFDPSLIESSTEVKVDLGSPDPDSLEPGSCIGDVTAGGALVRRVRLNDSGVWGPEYRLYEPTLAQPLGTRPLVDGATGRSIPVMDVNAPAAGYVPDGYTVRNAGGSPLSVWLNFQPGALAPLAVQSTYRNAAGDQIVVVTAASDHVTAGAQVIDHTMVDGHDATVTESPQTRCVTWAETHEHSMQVCSDTSQAKPAPDPGDRIDETELVQIADSVR